MSEGAQAERGCLALGAPGRVGRVVQCAALSAVDHDHLELLGHVDLTCREVGKVDEERATIGRFRNDKLVHQPRRNPCSGLLGTLTGRSHRDRLRLETERQRQSYLERRARGQPRAHRQRGVYGAAPAVSRLRQCDHRGHVAGPTWLESLEKLGVEPHVKVDFGEFGLLSRAEHHAVARVRDEGHGRAEVDGHWQSQAFVVVGVVPDQVHPPRAVCAGLVVLHVHRYLTHPR